MKLSRRFIKGWTRSTEPDVASPRCRAAGLVAATVTTMGTASSTSTSTTGTQSGPRHTLKNADDDVAHLVCCRAPIWDVAFCGAPAEEINLNAKTLCSMCAEVVLQRLPSCFDNDPSLCPMDRQPCPDEHEIDVRILREVSP